MLQNILLFTNGENRGIFCIQIFSFSQGVSIALGRSFESYLKPGGLDNGPEGIPTVNVELKKIVIR